MVVTTITILVFFLNRVKINSRHLQIVVKAESEEQLVTNVL